MCYFRRRDIPASLLSLADRHQGKNCNIYAHFFLPVSIDFYDKEFADNETETCNKDVQQTNSTQEKKPETSEQSSIETTASEDRVEKMEIDTEVEKKEEKKEEELEQAEVKAEIKEEHAEKTGEDTTVEKSLKKEPVDEEAVAKQKQQLNQRELFLSKQVEVLPATNIRGKCSVTLLNETESHSSYLDKEVCFSNRPALVRQSIYVSLEL